ncbi:MAG TPA: hypothetical protein GXZ45_01615 [Propionibacterium sp.]|nr:hypothetical protein [Propionibacterium sp.]
MPRRVGLPGASELFRATSEELATNADSVRAPEPDRAPANADTKPPRKRPAPIEPGPLAHTGRVRHDEKITVYVSSEELLALEHLRLELRAEHGLAVDRGRIVRAAIASALAAISEQGADADVVRRLSQ